MSCVMVINMGLKSIRCLVFNHLGVKLGEAALPINTAINDKCVEQDPAEWWEKAKLVMKKAVTESGIYQVDFVTVTASASCLVCVDKNGNSLERAFMISDKRAQEEVSIIAELEEYKEVQNATRLNISVSLMLPKILWIKRNREDIYEKTKFFLTPNDFMIYKLSGECVTDYLNAVKYHYDLHTKQYPEKLLKKLGISVQKLPRVVDIGQEAGQVYRNLAQEIGIVGECKVIVSSYDAICSFIGSGASQEGEASDVSGTVTVFRAFSQKSGDYPYSSVYDIPFYPENARIVGGSNNLGGGLIEWVKQCYYLKEEYPYEVMEREAGESEPGARGLIFLPYLLGERTPLWNDNARGVFFGLERMHTRKDMTRAVFESTGFIDRDIVHAIEESGIEVNTVRLSGGLARMNLISQIKADILGKEVIVLTEFETTSTGAAMLVFASRGIFKNQKEAAKRFAKIRMIIKPDKENHKRYEYIYELYKDTYQTLIPLFERRMQIIEEIRSDREVHIENL